MSNEDLPSGWHKLKCPETRQDQYINHELNINQTTRPTKHPQNNQPDARKDSPGSTTQRPKHLLTNKRKDATAASDATLEKGQSDTEPDAQVNETNKREDATGASDATLEKGQSITEPDAQVNETNKREDATGASAATLEKGQSNTETDAQVNEVDEIEMESVRVLKNEYLAPDEPIPLSYRPPKPQSENEEDRILNTIDKSNNQIQDEEKELDKLITQVREFTGKEKNPEYLYLDDMLVKSLARIDAIDSSGDVKVRQNRKLLVGRILKTFDELEKRLGGPKQ